MFVFCNIKNKVGLDNTTQYLFNFTFYVLEICENNISRKDFSERENYWFEKLKPSYNIQDILHPFSGSNHYRFGKNLDLNTKPLF